MSSGGGYSGTGDQPDKDQCNPNHPYKGHTPGYSGTGTKADKDNHANQGNPNNSRYQAPKK